MMNENIISYSGLDVEATGIRIGMLIDKSGLSDKKLSEMMGISIQAVNKWRHGHSLPDIENIYILAQLIHTDISSMLVSRNSAVSAGCGEGVTDYGNKMCFLRQGNF